MRQRENIWLPWHGRGPLGSRRSSEGIGGFVIASGGRLALTYAPAREYLASWARARAAWLSYIKRKDWWLRHCQRGPLGSRSCASERIFGFLGTSEGRLALVDQAKGLVASSLPAGAAWLSSMRQRENIWLPWHGRGPLGSRRSSEGIGGFVIASGGRLALTYAPAREYLASWARARAASLS